MAKIVTIGGDYAQIIQPPGNAKNLYRQMNLISIMAEVRPMWRYLLPITDMIQSL